jgi:hypothetical protein
MRRLASVGIINTSEAANAQLIDDTVAQQYRFVKTTAGGVCILGPIPYGKTVRCVKIAAQNEFQQAVMIGYTAETILASTKYRVEIWNNESDYETFRQQPLVYSTVSPASLTSAAVDRTNVYTALANKINAYPGNNVTAYGLTVVDFTAGTSTGDAATNFIPGEIVTQQTSAATAQVAKCNITSGTMAADNAAGKIYLYNISNIAGWLTTAVTLTAAGTVAAVTGITRGSTNCVVTQTNATTLHFQGLVIVDDAGYFTSSKFRGGINRVSVTAGFTTAVAEIVEAGNYALGVGSDMLLRMPVYDETKQVIITGDKELEFNDGDKPTAGQYYKKYIFEVQDGDVDALTANKNFTTRYHVLWFNQATSGHVSSLDSAIDTVIAK